MKILRVAILTLLAVAMASAQTAAPALSAEIPFAFEMAGVTLPAGEYSVTFSTERTWIMVRDLDSNDSALAVAFSVYPKDMSADNAKLIFNRYNDRYFLSQVWHPNVMRELPKSKQERELVTSRLLAKNPVRVVIAAKLVR
jgi:hypothetical protein